jgi:hypothetical protein
MESFACHGQIILFVGMILQRQSLKACEWLGIRLHPATGSQL